jgi:putative transposase
VKYEEMYVRAYETVRQACEGIRRYLSFFNAARPHAAHGGETPDSAYYASLPGIANAA